MASQNEHSQPVYYDRFINDKPTIYRAIVKDPFRCIVKIERLPDDLIAKAKKEGGIKIRTTDYNSNQHDHNYSRASWMSQPADGLHVTKWNGVMHAKENETIFESSSDSDSDISFDEVTTDSQCMNVAVNANKIKGPFISFDPSSDSDLDYSSDNDKDENDDELCDDLNYSINHNALDSDEDNESFTDSKSDTNREIKQQTNGVSATDSRICEEPTQTNGMDAHEMEYSPEISDDDEDELRFLYGIQEILAQSGDADACSANRCENGEVWPINRIFGEICVKYLRGKCYSMYCDFPHRLPTKEYVENQLKAATPDEIEDAQNKILLRQDNLLTDYFSVFCTFYGRKWRSHRESLRALIPILSQKLTAPILMKEILNGFVISGMKYSTCVNLLLVEIDSSLNTEERFEVMWQLIIDTRNDKIAEHLKQFEEILNSDALVAADAINKIIELQVNGDLESLRATIINFVKKTNVTTFMKIDSNLLKTYIRTYVRSFDDFAAKAIEQKATQFGVVFKN